MIRFCTNFMKFIEPTREYEQQICAFRKEFLEHGDSMDGTGTLIHMADPKQWIEYCQLCKDPNTVPEGLVPATQYIFVRESDNKIVGMLQIRHYFNAFLEQYGGHIGYSVASGERRKGYASQMLQLSLSKCKELGIQRVLITSGCRLRSMQASAVRSGRRGSVFSGSRSISSSG